MNQTNGSGMTDPDSSRDASQDDVSKTDTTALPDSASELPPGTSLPWDGVVRWWAAPPHWNGAHGNEAHRRRVGIRTVVIVMIVLVSGPLLMRLGQSAINGGWFGYSNWAMQIASIVFYLPPTIGALIDMQLAVWFHCRFPKQTPVRHIVIAVVVLAIVTQFIDSVGAYWLSDTISPMQANLINVLWNLMAVAVYLVALRALGPLVQFVWIDGDADARTFVPSRRWSTLGLMLATGVAAAYFAVMRFTAGQWSDPDGVAMIMPPLWLMSMMTVTSLCSAMFVIYMAAWTTIRPSWRRWVCVSIVVAAVGLTVSWANNVAFTVWTDSNNQTSFVASDWFQLSIQKILMWLGHLWFFGRWKQAGYRLVVWNRITGLSIMESSLESRSSE